MITKNLITKGITLTLVAGCLFSGCGKKAEDDKDTQSASDNEESEFVSNDAVNMADAADAGVNTFKNGDGTTYEALSGCATVTRDTMNSADPDTITIDFGSTPCLCKDNRYRSGQIAIIRSGKKWIAGSYRSVSFNNYYVGKTATDMNHIEGTHTVTFNGKNTAGNFNWDISAQNMVITKSNGKSHSWTSTRNREWTVGSGTLFNWTDDVYSITGSASGTNVNGNTYTANITNALLRHLNCKWFESGTIELTPQNKPTRTLDYGTDGNCDDQATVTIGSNTFTITLK